VQAHRKLAEKLRSDGSPELQQAQQRLSALEAAAERNRRRPINGANSKPFFGVKDTDTPQQSE